MNRFTILNPSSNEFALNVNTYNAYGVPTATQVLQPGGAVTLKLEPDQTYDVKPVQFAMAV